MDTRRHRLMTAALVLLAAAETAAAPVDTAMDVIYAAEAGDGYMLLDLMSQSLRDQLELRLAQLREIAAEHPDLAEAMVGGMGLELTALEILDIQTGALLSDLLAATEMPGAMEVVADSTFMAGRNADVELHFRDGPVVSMVMVWEEGAWRLNGGSFLEGLFPSTR